MVHTMEDVLARVSQWLGQTQGSLFSFTQQNLAEHSFSVLYITKTCKIQLFCPSPRKSCRIQLFCPSHSKILQNIDFLSFTQQNLAKFSFSVFHLAKSCKIQLFCPSPSKILQNIAFLSFTQQNLVKYSFSVLHIAKSCKIQYTFSVLHLAKSSFSIFHKAKSCKIQLFCPLQRKILQNIAFMPFTQQIFRRLTGRGRC